MLGGNTRLGCAHQISQPNAERQYRHLETTTLHDWEMAPELPPFRVLIALPSIERLALINLAAAYMQRAAFESAAVPHSRTVAQSVGTPAPGKRSIWH